MLSRDLHYADFVPLVNTSFALHGAAAVAPRVDIVLTSATENTNAPTHVGHDPQGLLYEACFNRIRARTAGQP
jgi:hypothetical protein